MMLAEEGAFELKDPVSRVHPGLRRPRASTAAGRPAARDRAGDRADADLAPADPHLGPHLRLPPRPPRRRACTATPASSWARPRGSTPPACVRPRGPAAAAVPARRRVELRRLHRRARPRGRGGVGPVARRLLRRADPRPLGMDETAFHLAGRPARPHGVASTSPTRPTAQRISSTPSAPIPTEPPPFLVGRRRAGVDGGRLPPLRRDAAPRRRARRGAPPRARARWPTCASNHLPGGADLEAYGRPLFAETTFDGVGFGLGVSVTVDPVALKVPGSAGEFGWGGAASTVLLGRPGRGHRGPCSSPSSCRRRTHPIRSNLQTLVHQSLVD